MYIDWTQMFDLGLKMENNINAAIFNIILIKSKVQLETECVKTFGII